MVRIVPIRTESDLRLAEAINSEESRWYLDRAVDALPITAAVAVPGMLRYVRTQAGVRKYKKPIGSLITASWTSKYDFDGNHIGEMVEDDNGIVISNQINPKTKENFWFVFNKHTGKPYTPASGSKLKTKKDAIALYEKTVADLINSKKTGAPSSLESKPIARLQTTEDSDDYSDVTMSLEYDTGFPSVFDKQEQKTLVDGSEWVSLGDGSHANPGDKVIDITTQEVTTVVNSVSSADTIHVKSADGHESSKPKSDFNMYTKKKWNDIEDWPETESVKGMAKLVFDALQLELENNDDPVDMIISNTIDSQILAIEQDESVFSLDEVQRIAKAAFKNQVSKGEIDLKDESNIPIIEKIESITTPDLNKSPLNQVRLSNDNDGNVPIQPQKKVDYDYQPTVGHSDPTLKLMADGEKAEVGTVVIDVFDGFMGVITKTNYPGGDKQDITVYDFTSEKEMKIPLEELNAYNPDKSYEQKLGQPPKQDLDHKFVSSMNVSEQLQTGTHKAADGKQIIEGGHVIDNDGSVYIVQKTRLNNPLITVMSLANNEMSLIHVSDVNVYEVNKPKIEAKETLTTQTKTSATPTTGLPNGIPKVDDNYDFIYGKENTDSPFSKTLADGEIPFPEDVVISNIGEIGVIENSLLNNSNNEYVKVKFLDQKTSGNYLVKYLNLYKPKLTSVPTPEKDVHAAKSKTEPQKFTTSGFKSLGANSKDPSEKHVVKKTLGDGTIPKVGDKVFNEAGETGTVAAVYQAYTNVKWDSTGKIGQTHNKKLNSLYVSADASKTGTSEEVSSKIEQAAKNAGFTGKWKTPATTYTPGASKNKIDFYDVEMGSLVTIDDLKSGDKKSDLIITEATNIETGSSVGKAFIMVDADGNEFTYSYKAITKHQAPISSDELNESDSHSSEPPKASNTNKVSISKLPPEAIPDPSAAPGTANNPKHWLISQTANWMAYGKWLTKQQKSKWIGSDSKAQYAMAKSYTGKYHGVFTSALKYEGPNPKKIDGSTKEKIAVMDAAFKNGAVTPTKEWILLSRGGHIEELEALAFDNNLKNYTSVSKVRNAVVGKTLTLSTYKSTSITTVPAFTKPVRFIFRVPPGTPALYVAGDGSKGANAISHYPSEREVILPRNMKVVVKSVTESTSSGQSYDIVLEIVPK